VHFLLSIFHYQLKKPSGLKPDGFASNDKISFQVVAKSPPPRVKIIIPLTAKTERAAE
jgi:hypothetical protein